VREENGGGKNTNTPRFPKKKGERKGAKVPTERVLKKKRKKFSSKGNVPEERVENTTDNSRLPKKKVQEKLKGKKKPRPRGKRG